MHSALVHAVCALKTNMRPQECFLFDEKEDMATMLRTMSALMGYSIHTLHVRSVAKRVRPTATACVMALLRVDVVLSV